MSVKEGKKLVTISGNRPLTTETKAFKPDKDGYYEITVGNGNKFSLDGSYFKAEGAINILKDKNSSINKLLSSGYLKGELGHPKKGLNESDKAFNHRNTIIREDNVSHFIKEVSAIETNVNENFGGFGNIVDFVVKLKPAGPHGPALKEALEDPDQNVAFSVRAFSVRSYIGNTIVYDNVAIITWDWVGNPGMAVANKWDTIRTNQDGDTVMAFMEPSLDYDINIYDVMDGKSVEECFSCTSLSDSSRTVLKEAFGKVNNMGNDHTALFNW